METLLSPPSPPTFHRDLFPLEQLPLKQLQVEQELYGDSLLQQKPKDLSVYLCVETFLHWYY